MPAKGYIPGTPLRGSSYHRAKWRERQVRDPNKSDQFWVIDKGGKPKRVLVPGKILGQVLADATKAQVEPQLEDQYPIPTLRERMLAAKSRGPRAKYPFADMKVGQSFFVAGTHETNVRVAASNSTDLRGHEYFVGAVEGGVRVWRVR